MGKNSRDYALGNRFAPGQSVTGLLPAPLRCRLVTNPDLFGGKEIELRLGSKVRVNKGLQERFALNVYSDRPQPKELDALVCSALERIYEFRFTDGKE